MSRKVMNNMYDFLEDDEPVKRGKPMVKKVSSKSVYTGAEAFAMHFSRVVDNPESFQKVLDLYQELEKSSLIATLHKASREIDEYWKLVEEMRNFTDEEIEEKLAGKSSSKALQPFKAVQKALWNEGSPVVDFGLDPLNFGADSSEIVKAALSDTQSFVQAIRVQKEMALDNFATRLVECLPSQQQRQYTSRQSRLTLLKTLVGDFTQGKMTVRFNIEKFKLPTEAFLTVPTVLESKDALTIAVVRLINSLYDEKLIVAFQEKDMNQIRMYTGGSDDFLLYSEDEDSPYAITRTPALYESRVIDGIWKWRDVETLANKKANLMLAEKGISLDNQYERDKIIRSLEFEATQVIEENDRIHFTYDATIASLPEVLQERFEGKKGILRIFQRGYSTKQEVEENPEFLHITKKSIARQFESSMYPIVLADLNSVVLMPMDLWIKSRFHRTVAASGKKSLYLTEHGMRMLTKDSEVLNFFFSMVQVSTLFAMLEDWESGKTFDQDAYAKKIIKATVLDPHPQLAELYVGPFSSLSARKEQLKKFGLVCTSTIVGCLVAPTSSRTGKSMLETINNNLKSVSEYEQYEQVYLDHNYEFDMFGDIFEGLVEDPNYHSQDEEEGDQGDETNDKDVFTGIESESIFGFDLWE